MKTTRLVSVAVLFVAALAFAAPEIPPVKQIEGVTPKEKAFEASGPRKPLVFTTEKEAAEYFAEEELAKLARQVDFKNQVVLVFAWQGSGQDKLDYAVAESFPEQVMFTYRPGRTKDLRSHVRVYALRSNVKWNAK